MTKLDWSKPYIPRDDGYDNNEEYEPTSHTVRALLELQTIVGGRYWNRGGHHRLYLDDGIYVVARTNTLYLRGESIPASLDSIVNEFNIKLIRKEYDACSVEPPVNRIPRNARSKQRPTNPPKKKPAHKKKPFRRR